MPALEIFLLEVKDALATATMTAFLFLTAQSRRLALEVLLSMVLVAVMELKSVFPAHTAFLFLTAQSRRLTLEVLLSMVLVAVMTLEVPSKGINIFSSTVESKGTGSITFKGTGGNGTFNNQGISITDKSTVQSAGDGTVTITGTGEMGRPAIKGYQF